MSLFDFIAKGLCPPSCVCCKSLLPFYTKDAFCNECYEELYYRLLDNSCDMCLPYLDNLYFLYEYKSWYVKQMIIYTKEVCGKEYLDFIGKTGFKSLKKHNLLGEIDIISFTPRRVFQKQKFDFDQAEELATAISNSTGIPCRQLVFRQGHARPQKKLNKKGRQENVIGKFKCENDLDLNGKKILLVDDVVTTGSTMEECARLLKEHGAKSVIGWCLAK